MSTTAPTMTAPRQTAREHSIITSSAKAVLSRAKTSVRYILRKHILQTATPVDEWFHADGDRTLSTTYPLHSGSTVFEVGGYTGTWSAKLAKLYDPFIYAFEPVQSFYSELAQRFAANHKVRAFNFGLSDQNETGKICVSSDGSSLLKSNGPLELVQLREICEVVEELGISNIDLIQINIEGGEFRLLHRMLETGLTKRCSNIQIQFHAVIPGAMEQREDIRRRLETTHSLLYDYPFVWEAWRLK